MKKLLLIVALMLSGCVDCNCGGVDDDLDFLDSVETAKDVTQDKDEWKNLYLYFYWLSRVVAIRAIASF